MIAIGNNKLKKIAKISLIIFAIYTVFYLAFQVFHYYLTYTKLEKLKTQVREHKQELNTYKQKVRVNQQKIKKIKDSYQTKEEIETKTKNIFKRMSVLNYDLNLLKIKPMCIDRYILFVELDYEDEDALEAGKKILSYIGNVKKYKDSDIYLVDYKLKAKE